MVDPTTLAGLEGLQHTSWANAKGKARLEAMNEYMEILSKPCPQVSVSDEGRRSSRQSNLGTYAARAAHSGRWLISSKAQAKMLKSSSQSA